MRECDVDFNNREEIAEYIEYLCCEICETVQEVMGIKSLMRVYVYIKQATELAEHPED